MACLYTLDGIQYTEEEIDLIYRKAKGENVTEAWDKLQETNLQAPVEDTTEQVKKVKSESEFLYKKQVKKNILLGNEEISVEVIRDIIEKDKSSTPNTFEQGKETVKLFTGNTAKEIQSYFVEGEASKTLNDWVISNQKEAKIVFDYFSKESDGGTLEEFFEEELTKQGAYQIQDKRQLDLFSENIVTTDTTEETLYQNNTGQSKEEYIASEKTIRDLAAKMADRIGLKVKYVSDRTLDYKGKLEGDTAVINLAYATLDTPIHEILSHPIIRTLKNKAGLTAKQQLNQQVESGKIEKEC